ncbi:MAG TPA: hypothetical protein PK054_04545 [Anaerohalosphaeraceae bacterium]|nr:hypothetical protein [Anaerohalosphaeraceae bacterium]HOL87660.1 hypothetical protein [Anaerohalosphaeraceae bacterium]HPP55833.1 hypothetical protein [Anaerohalosphaeraceae bacterium]
MTMSGFSNRNAEAVLATSISPRNPDNQQRAVQSWLKAGFSVISVNNPEEIELLRPLFPQVVFVPARRNGQEHFGKPLIYIDDLLATLRETGASTVGLINSDIHLKITEAHRRVLEEVTPKSVLCVHRVGVQSLDEEKGELFIGGVDAFLFHRRILEQIPPSIFCLGVPWWDYYFPIVCILNQVPLVRFQEPIAYHRKHPLNWDMKLWHRMGRYFYGRLLELCAEKTGYNPFQNLAEIFGNAWKCYHIILTQKKVPLAVVQRNLAYCEFIFGIICGSVRILEPVVPSKAGAVSPVRLENGVNQIHHLEVSTVR